MTLFSDAVAGHNQKRPPIWMMRQAGRYHAHYRALKEKYTFLQLCKQPELACEVTIGPINAFNFDAAILFSDILFPLEILGTPLDFAPGPQLGFLLQTKQDLQRYTKDPDVSQLQFQADALAAIREELPREKGLIGFVGGLLTLYVFAVHGTHKTVLTSAHEGLTDGRFDGFMQIMLPLLLQNMVLQAQKNCDALAIFESCAGDFDIGQIQHRYLPYLQELIKQFKVLCPHVPLIYYGKGVGQDYWDLLSDLPIQVLGVDQYQDLPACMDRNSNRFSIQGNFDPHHLVLEEDVCEKLIRDYFQTMYQCPQDQLQKWICGTGHGLVPQVREANVANFIRIAHEMWDQHRA